MTQGVDACFADAVGPGGIPRSEFEELLDEAAAALERLRQARASGTHRFLACADSRDDLAALEALARDWRGRYRRLVVLGTGGASLGGQALAATGLESERLLVLDNGDADRLDSLLNEPGLDRTGFLVQPGASPLRRLAARFDLPVLDHDPALGGRFSALSLVGLLPAMFAGIDGRAARDGAQTVLRAALEAPSPERSAPAVGAALAVAAMRAWPAASMVLMPYGPNLYSFGLWYRQLWAESLGKDGHGSTPILAPGPVDQHSQLQLWLDGPADKLFTLIVLDRAGRGARIAADLAADPELSYIRNRTLGDLMDAEQRATAETLARHGRPTRVISLPRLDERAMGAMMMHYMLETMIAAHLLGVDAFDQPAVEEGKILTRSYLAADAT